jgi:hypothetical protein
MWLLLQWFMLLLQWLVVGVTALRAALPVALKKVVQMWLFQFLLASLLLLLLMLLLRRQGVQLGRGLRRDAGPHPCHPVRFDRGC